MDIHNRRTALLVAVSIALGLLVAARPGTVARTSTQIPQGSSLAPFVPSPQEVVDRMLALAGVTASDVVYDLGCGDGRIVITAAQRYGARAVGVDIDPARVAESEANAKKAGVEKLVSFVLEDAMKVDVSPATVVTLYLLSSSNRKLRPILTRQLKPGARIVSHSFDMGDWEPAKKEVFEDAKGLPRIIFLWKADGKERK
jgi:ubiquinone/menaquinone biosynthesis C-methylase UbiE